MCVCVCMQPPMCMYRMCVFDCFIVCAGVFMCTCRCLYVHMLLCTHTVAAECEDLIDLLLKNMLFIPPLPSLSLHLSVALAFFSTVIHWSWSSFFFLSHFPSLSSSGGKCIKPLYGADMGSILDQYPPLYWRTKKKKKKTPLCSSVSKSLPSS